MLTEQHKQNIEQEVVKRTLMFFTHQTSFYVSPAEMWSSDEPTGFPLLENRSRKNLHETEDAHNTHTHTHSREMKLLIWLFFYYYYSCPVWYFVVGLWCFNFALNLKMIHSTLRIPQCPVSMVTSSNTCRPVTIHFTVKSKTRLISCDLFQDVVLINEKKKQFWWTEVGKISWLDFFIS